LRRSGFEEVIFSKSDAGRFGRNSTRAASGNQPENWGEVAIEQEVGPPPEIRYRRAFQLRSELRELIEARHVIYSLTERDLRSRYSQMALGFLWNILGPLSLTIVFGFVLNKANVNPPFDVPRPVWLYTALMPWSFFSGAVSSGGLSLVSNNSLLNKVYVPREVFPISQIAEQIVDSTCAATAFVALLILYRFPPASTFYWAPIPLLIALVFATAVSILLAGLTVYFRDLRQAIPVMLQLGLFVNPIAYDLSKVSPALQPVLVALDPLAASIDGLRRCLLYGQAPNWGLTALAAVVASAELCIAYVVFKQMEAGFADVA
jgi:ABC-2 type transport system permease protein/lipopolysaccharide transport system permease protein